MSNLLVWLISRGGQILFIAGGVSVLVYVVRGLIREGGL